MQILNRSLVCDAFYTTADYLAELSEHADLRKHLGNLLPTKRFNLIVDAHELQSPIHDAIVHNHDVMTRCDVIVGVVSVLLGSTTRHGYFRFGVVWRSSVV